VLKGAGVRAIVLAAVCAGATNVAAQSVPHVYVSAGGAVAWRERPVWPRSAADLDRSHRGLTPAVTAAAGVQVNRDLAVEGSVQFQRGQSAPWRFSYGPRTTDELTTHRDTPVVGYVRYTPRLGRRVGIEPLGGAGWSWHKTRSFTTARCGSPNFPKPCVPVSPPEMSDALASFEFLIAAGLDVPVRVSSKTSLAPTLRLLRVSRRPYLTGYVHRGPANGSGVILTIGMSATWRSY
jgi:hypothetical protein